MFGGMGRGQMRMEGFCFEGLVDEVSVPDVFGCDVGGDFGSAGRFWLWQVEDL